MQTLKEQIDSEFGLMVPQLRSDGVTLDMTSTWDGKTPGISDVKVYLSGRSPLSGREIPREEKTFNRLNKYCSLCLKQYGDFLLHFDAVRVDGERIKDFRKPAVLRFSYSPRKPKVEINCRQLKNFIKLSISYNCWYSCRNNIWLRYNNHFQTVEIPENSENCVFYLPGIQKPELSFSPELSDLLG